MKHLFFLFFVLAYQINIHCQTIEKSMEAIKMIDSETNIDSIANYLGIHKKFLKKDFNVIDTSLFLIEYDQGLTKGRLETFRIKAYSNKEKDKILHTLAQLPGVLWYRIYKRE